MTTTFVSIEQLRSIGDWSRTYTWNVYFSPSNDANCAVNVPAMFRDWFPATDCTIGVTSVEKQDFTGGIGSFSIPKNYSELELTITLLDNYVLSMHRWIYSWMRQIVNVDEGYVVPVKNACCKCTIVTFDSLGKNPYIGEYMVFPNGLCDFQGNSSGDIRSREVTFSVAGVISHLFD